MSAEPQALSPALYRCIRFVSEHLPFFYRLGNVESALLRGEIEHTRIIHPIYITGLARAGSTLLLEVLAAHPQTATHLNRDFPFVPIPYLWNKALAFTPRKSAPLKERFHRDGMMVGPDSPEALDEMLWRAYGGQADFPPFYRDHIAKLLIARKRPRYAAKNNALWMRLPRLLALFPDARIVVPVRHPVAHVASLMRQHERFSLACAGDPRLTRHLMLAGHFEFGPRREPLAPSAEEAESITRAWEESGEARGWARMWNAAYNYLRELSVQYPANIHFLRHEDVRSDPFIALSSLLAYCSLVPDEPLVRSFAARIHGHRETGPGLTAEEKQAILAETVTARQEMGYGEEHP